MFPGNLSLFKSLFRGREDIFAVHWEKGGKSSYFPQYDYDPYQYRLQKIHRDQWIKFIQTAFDKTGKHIAIEEASLIAETARDHPYYVQQLANEVWIVSEKTATRAIVLECINRVMDTNTIFYQEAIDNLNNTQINLLIAIINGTKQLSSAEAMSKFNIGTPNNIRKNKAILEQKDILDFHTGDPSFLDPFFEYWFRKNFLT